MQPADLFLESIDIRAALAPSPFDRTLRSIERMQSGFFTALLVLGTVTERLLPSRLPAVSIQFVDDRFVKELVASGMF